ncbi:Tfp pilus assembly protein, tip-associated adhesin PilY1 [Variovorax sp. PBS-H4]|uniref:pilus assembly protein n=1 Tax=Variovorax sp. PBS-H4 TaxID=434008 RepID=UPI00131866A9|nr:PilC/PilY family type IV pilus protein [Variovorax sp. PBS-H4]VTU33759.1 Tfp pilus assembly protein, tip-associated adhesin PilY1 [Variovorax sp. PBS-H4]
MLDLVRNLPPRLRNLLRAGSWSRAQRLLVGLFLPVMAIAVSVAVRSQTVAPAIPQVSLSSDPLYATASGDKPTMALALSVEWPTAGAQYIKGSNALDNSYTNTSEYLGYYDTESCYAYNDKPTETLQPSEQTTDYKRFDRTGPATSRMCADGFSGNFLNWASGSAIDMLRLSLSGGDRSIDREDLTILQRAFVPNGDPHCLWNSTSFPAKQLQRDGGGAGAYWGAIPVAMRKAAAKQDVWVANTLNQIFFGTFRGAGCGMAGVHVGNGSYTLGSNVPTVVANFTPVFQPLPSDASPACATENGICTFSGIRQVWYGSGTQWAVAAASGPIICTSRMFSNFAPDVSKACYTRPYTGTWKPTAAAKLITAGPVTRQNQSLPNDASAACATEGGTCTFDGIKEVWYGAGTHWDVAPAVGPITCYAGQVFGDPIYGVVKSCYTRNYAGPWLPSYAADPAAPGSGSSAALNSDGFFYARVKVCDQDASGALLDVRDYGAGHNFCTAYPSTKYKPTGAIQKYANSLRLAAFGYALDQTLSPEGGRYGGVLRAPMKYVGNKTFDKYGQNNTPAGGNPAAEWDARTGVFYANPDNDTTQTPAISGVINYLNKFGRTSATPGRYKDWDPVGELYYETLRYLQGLPPSPDAVSKLTPDMYDGFPIFTDWSGLDPFADRSPTSSYACLRNNIVVIGDIETHDTPNYGRFPGANLAINVPDFAASLATVASFESGTATSYEDGQGMLRTTSNPNTPNPYKFGTEMGIAGTAYWAHTHDIRGTNWTAEPSKQRPGLRTRTFTFDVNEYGNQNLAANRHYLNPFFTAAKYGGYESMPSRKDTARPYNTWGNPFMRDGGTVENNVWQDPTQPGEAATYALQSNGRAELSAFDKIFDSAGEPTFNIAGAAAQAGVLTQGTNNTIFQAQFDSTDWSGDVVAKIVSVDASNQVSLSQSPQWSAAERLRNFTDPVNNRNIVIGNAGATSSPVASAFKWNEISSVVQQALNKPDPSSAADNQGEDRLKFIRGDHSKEGNVFRNREGKSLGDIVNSGVAYSGAPNGTINSSTYPAFREDNKNRTPAVFAGANDGMMHAFNATTGDELFGYIPSWLAPKLSVLTSKDYMVNHQSYVDATPVVADAEVGTNWKTVLVGGTGAGGRGVYALDVTDPAAFSASKVMWEFTPADDIDSTDSNYSLGNVVGRPQILKFRTSATGAPPAYKWFAVVASGVNNYVPDAEGHFSSTGRPAIYLLDLAKPQGTAWSLNSNYYKISIPVDSSLSSTQPPGVLNFKAALGAQQEVTKLFVGDLHGKLWKLDFTPWGTDHWNMADLSAFHTGTQPYPLFIARSATGQVQPISAAPLLVRGSAQQSIYVAFGTGKYLEATDSASAITNSFYVVNDDGTARPDSTSGSPASAITGRGRLQGGTFNSTTGDINVPAFVWGRAASDGDTTQRSGWYLDFPSTGERQVTGTSLAGDTLIFSSLTPNPSTSASICGAGGGTGREYRLTVDTGDGASTQSTVGLLGESMAMRIASATTSTITDSTGRRHRTITTQSISQGTTGLAATSTVTQEEIAGRLSWRQIHNYRDLKTQ